MAFTEAQLTAQLDPNGTNKTILIERFVPVGTTLTDIYVVPITGYRGNSKWVQLAQTLTAAQAATAIQTALT